MGSEKNGWLVPVPGDEAESTENVLAEMVQALCSLPGENVRPRYQPLPKAAPGNRTDWCAFGIIGEDAPGGSVWHEKGYSRLEVDQTLEALFSFYGPHAREKARALRDGLWIEQNRGILKYGHNLALSRIEPFRHAPDLIDGRWVMRCDLPVVFVKGPKIMTRKDRPEESEGYVDIKDLKTASPCGLCQRSR